MIFELNTRTQSSLRPSRNISPMFSKRSHQRDYPWEETKRLPDGLPPKNPHLSPVPNAPTTP
ncbi:hypothetical protein BC829DRAFT_380837 [Chytridium lagenaria]|nr:hypothetical protein BC829DRAFT_380837 [Chytridium lagenaria]